MENNYNFDINPSPIDKNKIEKHKDFDALMKRVEVGAPTEEAKRYQFSAETMYQWIAGIAAILMVGITFFNGFKDTNNSYISESKAYFAAQPFVNPPLENAIQKTKTLTVNANEGGTYTFASGSKMMVPKSAFANSYGTLIEGDVTIHFKEYHDYVDIFLSGIPMEIKVDGKDHILESAGMIEVYATQNGERLSLAPDKPIDIALKSKLAFEGDTPPDFNIYYLNEEQRVWNLEGKDIIELVAQNNDAGTINVDNNTHLDFDSKSNEITPESLKEAQKKRQSAIDDQLKKQLAQIEGDYARIAKPQKPERYDGNSMTFEFDYSGDKEKTKFYNGTIWQVITPIDAFDDITTTTWEEPFLEKQTDGSFVVNLKKGDKQAKLKVKPVLTGNDYDQAIQQFAKEIDDYQEKNERIAAEKALKKRQINERIAIEKEMADKTFEERMAALKAKGHNYYATEQIIKRTVLNKFTITRFGTWNCDRPLPPYLARINGVFQDQSDNRFRNSVVYHSDKTRNTVSRFYLKDMANVQYNAGSDNLFWIVTEDSKLAVFYPEYFERIKKLKGDYAFEMDLTTASINSEAEVRKVLRL